MSDLNSVVIEGNLTRDVVVRYIADGTAVASFSIAVNKQPSKNGAKADSVSYIDIVVWGKQAESCGTYLSKGSKIIIEGSLEQRRWEKDGEKKSKVEVVAKPYGVHFRSKKKESGSSAAGGDQDPGPPVDEGDVPF